MTNWNANIDRLHDVLKTVSFRDDAGRSLDADSAFARWRDMAVAVRDMSRTIYLVGNGASASMASHFAADLAKNGHLHTQVFSDLSLITAISNDIGYEQVFAEPLRRRGQRGDLLVAISSSGRSPNILAVVKVAQEQGLAIVTLSGMNPENPLRTGGSLNIYAAAQSYGLVETAHAAILHRWMDLVDLNGSNP